MDETQPPENVADAFQLISNEFRVAILMEIAHRSDPLSFSELMAALDEPDSGRLNYHLNQLRGIYVIKEKGNYRLTIQGAKIVSSILASSYVDTETNYSVPVDGPCYDCGTDALHLEQTGQQAIVRCRDCGCKQFRKSVPTAIWKNREQDSVPAVLDQIVWAELRLATNHICSYCYSAMTPRVAENRWDWDAELYGLYDFDVVAVYECELCTNWKLAPHGLIAWLHPTVRSFHRKFGINPDTVMCWQLDQGMDEKYTSVVSTEPYEIEVRFPVEAAECQATFNEENEIIRVTREMDR